MDTVWVYLMDLALFFSVSTVLQWVYPAIRRNISSILASWLPIFSGVLAIFFLVGWGDHWLTVVAMASTVALASGKTESANKERQRVVR
jgi:phosphatidylserine synthase